jgi:hypothetical protein
LGRVTGSPFKTPRVLLAGVVLGGVVLVVAATGCGAGSGVAEDAKVAVYVSEPLCAGAEAGLARKGFEVDGVGVGIVCLPAAGEKGRLDLATAGAQARRATQDSTTVAFVVPEGREIQYTRPILKEADIAVLEAESGSKAIGEVLDDLGERGGKSPREAVFG